MTRGRSGAIHRFRTQTQTSAFALGDGTCFVVSHLKASKFIEVSKCHKEAACFDHDGSSVARLGLESRSVHRQAGGKAQKRRQKASRRGREGRDPAVRCLAHGESRVWVWQVAPD